MKNPEIMSNELSREQKHAIDAAVMALKKILPPEYPFDKAEQAIKRWALKWGPNQTAQMRHGNALNFRKHYFPLVEKLHKKNPKHQWTFGEMAACLVAYIENHPAEVPKSQRIGQDTIRKSRLPRYMEVLCGKFDVVFTSKAPISQGSATVP